MSARTLLGLAGAALVGAGLVLAVYFWRAAPSGGAPGDVSSVRIPADDPELIAKGRALYAEACASCHGADLGGQAGWRQRNPDGTLPAPPHDASGHTWHHPDPLLFAYTKYGGARFMPEGRESAMPGFADRLGDGEIRATLAYIKSTWPAEIREKQARLTERAAAGE